MDKVFDRLLVEFLIPAFLMFLCLLLGIDLSLGHSFDLINVSARKQLLDEGYLLIPGVLIAYLLNTSASALFNLMLRAVSWGRVREYFILRKLNVFKSGPLKGITWLGYLRHTKAECDAKLEPVLKQRADNLYADFMVRMQAESISAKSVRDLVDAYDNLRTIVLNSGENAVIEWIQYHWSQLRLARGTIVPAFLLLFLVPAVVQQWGCSGLWVAGWSVGALIFFLLQWVHYYYRERFMTYAMVNYFLLKSSKHEGTQRNA